MENSKTYTAVKSLSVPMRIREYLVLGKHRLSFTVVVSALLGYLLTGNIVLNEMLFLGGGGFLLTLSSNAFNQIIEREFDKLMQRTQYRPLVKNSLSVREALIFAIITGISGLTLLYFLNTLTLILGALSIFLYVFVYTPMKRLSPWAVFVGAIPGAMPPLMGYVASTGDFGLTPGILFLVQFIWQFPHFWAIAWFLDDDYKRAGYRLLPSKFGRNKSSSFQIVVYTIASVFAGFSPYMIGICGIATAISAAVLGAIFIKYALILHTNQQVADGRKLMFASLFYLPLLQLIYVIDYFIWMRP